MRQFAVAAFLVPASAVAQEHPVTIDYAAPAGCPDRASFVEHIAERTPGVVPTPDARLIVRARVATRGAGYEGEIAFDHDGQRSPRRVSDRSCAHVVEALALIAALAIDPASDEPAGDSPATSQPPASVPPPASMTPPPATQAAPTIEAPPRTNEVAGAPAPAFRVSVGANVALVPGVTPDLLVSVPVFAELSSATASLRARVERAQRTSAADFVWTAVSVEGCPFLMSSGPVTIAPCARLRLGALAATGVDVVPSRSATRAWVDAGLLLRARLAVFRSFFVELEGGAAGVLTRDRFYVEPDQTVHRAPAVIGIAAFGAGVTFF